MVTLPYVVLMPQEQVPLLFLLVMDCGHLYKDTLFVPQQTAG